MRTLKDIRELYEPKAADEKRFADKHIVKKTKDANGNGDDVFNAKNVKSVRDDKKEKNHGYPPGKDEEVYEQKKMESCDDDDEEDEDEDVKKEGFVSDAQRKAIWATKKDGGKGHPDNKKKMKEEIEQVDEVLKPSMGVKAYIDDFVKSDDPRFKGASKKERIKRAVAAYYSAKRTQKEEVELDEAVQHKRILDHVNSVLGKLETKGNINNATRHDVASKVKSPNPHYKANYSNYGDKAKISNALKAAGYNVIGHDRIGGTNSVFFKKNVD